MSVEAFTSGVNGRWVCECGQPVVHRLGAWMCPTHDDRATVRFVEHPPDDDVSVDHRRSPDGLTLTTTVTAPRGFMRMTMTWADRATADKHVADEMQTLEQRGRRELADSVPGESLRTFARRTRIGTFGAGVQTGPPTWWLPRPIVHADRGSVELGVGWLRLVVRVYWGWRRKRGA